MQESPAIKDAMARSWKSMSAGDATAAAELITASAPAIVVGTGPGEGRDGADAWRQGVKDTIEGMPGVGIEPGPNPRAYEENGVGWLTDEPTWILPDGTRISTRVTTVWRKEEGAWRAVHLNLSVGVPDEKLGEIAGS